MAGFNFPVVATNPNSLPALLRQKMISPGLVPGPVQKPQLTSGFRVPSVPGMGSLPAPLQAPQPGFNVQDLARGIGDLLNSLKPASENPADPAAFGRVKGDADLNGYNGSPTMVDVGNRALLPNPNAPAGAGGGGGPFGFLGSISDFLKRWSPQSSSNALPLPNSSWESFRG
jgi:hypothetical protein